MVEGVGGDRRRATSVVRLPAAPHEDTASASRLARTVVGVVTGGFFFGGFVGLVQSSTLTFGSKCGAFALLVVLVALHVRNCVRRADGRRPAGWAWTLAAQVLLTYVPMVWLHETWYGNPGFLAGAFLLLLRPAWLAWAGFLVILVVHVQVGLAVRPTLVEALYLVAGQAALVGLAVYAIARLADLVAALSATRTALAEAGVARERLRFGETLTAGVGASLSRIVDRGDALLAGLRERPEHARVELAAALEEARGAMNQARAFAHAHKNTEESPPPPVREPTPRAVAVLRVTILCLLIVPLPTRMLAAGRHSAAEQALFAVLMLAFVALYVRNCTPGDGGRPRWWRWTSAAQVALAYVPLLVFDVRTWSVGLYLTGLALVLLRGPWRWLVAAALAGQDLPFGVWSASALDAVYNIVWIAERAALVYGLVRMAELARELGRVRAELIATHVARERLRFGRDLHDLLGFSLSALVLKSQLALRFADRDPQAAHAQFAEGLVMARQALSDVDTVAGGYRGMSLAIEAPTAHDILTAAGLAVEVTVDVGVPAPDVDTVLATVVREGATNVLRHSSARRCAITALVEADGALVLTLVNDGVHFRGTPGTGLGMGLTSLVDRLDALGGTLTAEAVSGEFHLRARIPGPGAGEPVADPAVRVRADNDPR